MVREHKPVMLPFNDTLHVTSHVRYSYPGSNYMGPVVYRAPLFLIRGGEHSKIKAGHSETRSDVYMIGQRQAVWGSTGAVLNYGGASRQ